MTTGNSVTAIRLILALSIWAAQSATATAAAQTSEESPPEDTCVLSVHVPLGAQIEVDGRDYGGQRRFTFRGLKAKRVYRSKLRIRYSGGSVEEATLLLRPGRQVALARPGPDAPRLDLVSPYGSAASPVSWGAGGKHALCGNLLCLVETGQHLRRFAAVTSPSCVALSPAGRRAALFEAGRPSEGGRLHVYDTANGRLEWTGELGELAVRQLLFRSDGKTLAAHAAPAAERAGGETHRVVVWNAASGKFLRRFDSSGAITALRYAAEGKILCIGRTSRATGERRGAGASVIGWDVDRDEVLFERSGTGEAIVAMALHGDGRLAALTRHALHVWDERSARAAPRSTPSVGNVERLILAAKSGEMVAVALDPRSKRYCFTSWDVESRLCTRSLAVPVAEVPSGWNVHRIAPAGHWLIIARHAGEAEGAATCRMSCVDEKTGRVIWSSQREGAHVAIAPDGQTGLCHVGQGAFFSFETGSGKRVREMELKGIEAGGKLAYSPGGKRLLVTSGGDAVLVDTETWSEIRRFRADDLISDLAFSPDGGRLVIARVGDARKRARVTVWNVDDGKLHAWLLPFVTEKDLPAAQRRVAQLAFSPAGNRLAVRRDDGRCVIVDVDQRTMVSALDTPLDNIRPRSLAFATNDQVWTGGRARLAIWTAGSGRLADTLSLQAGSLAGLRWSDDGRQIVTYGDAQPIRDGRESSAVELARFDSESLRQIDRPGYVVGHAVADALSPDGSQILVERGGQIHVCDSAGGRPTRALGRPGRVRALDLGGQGVILHIDTPGERRLVELFEDPRILARLEAQPLRTVVLSPDRKRLFVSYGGAAPEEDRAELWDLANGRTIAELAGAQAQVRRARFSLDGRLLALMDEDQVALRHARTGRLRSEVDLPADAARRHASERGLALAADGSVLFTSLPVPSREQQPRGPRRWRVTAWDATSGRAVTTLTARALSACLAVGPGGRMLVSGPDREGHATVWDLQEGWMLRRLEGEGLGPATCALFSPDSQWLVTQVAGQPWAYLWDLRQSRLLRKLEIGSVVGISRDGQVLLGTDKMVDLASGDTLASFLIGSSPAEVVAVTPQGLFDGSAAAADEIMLRLDGTLRLLPLGQFREKLHAPGLVAALLQGKRPLPDAKWHAHARTAEPKNQHDEDQRRAAAGEEEAIGQVPSDR